MRALLVTTVAYSTTNNNIESVSILCYWQLD